MEFTALHRFTIVLLCSFAASHGIVRFENYIVLPVQPMENAAIEMSKERSIGECAWKCAFNPNCHIAYYENVTKRCDFIGDIVFFTPGIFEPGNYTIAVSYCTAIFFNINNTNNRSSVAFCVRECAHINLHSLGHYRVSYFTKYFYIIVK